MLHYLMSYLFGSCMSRQYRLITTMSRRPLIEYINPIIAELPSIASIIHH